MGHQAQGGAAGGEGLILAAMHWQTAVQQLQEARGSND
jgi:hypothetical protein